MIWTLDRTTPNLSQWWHETLLKETKNQAVWGLPQNNQEKHKEDQPASELEPLARRTSEDD